MGQSLHFGLRSQVQQKRHGLAKFSESLPRALHQSTQRQQQSILNMSTRLGLLDPHLVLERGYAWLTDSSGQALTHPQDFQAGQPVIATLADGQVHLEVKQPLKA